ncbi:MAR-binding filament-like protein 1-1 [Aristolochia californica]|uniref:MAR-binding filament-like protein 1-1 n=1 Tax=Aristolochia californica TaxID=171875 RepID=UPI0035E0E8F0
MALTSDIDDYIQQSMEYCLGLPVSEKTLQSKLLASEEARHRLQGEIFQLHDSLRKKDRKIQLSVAEASLNAQALKKHIEENMTLRAECSDLLHRCDKLEKECSLYDRDRDALMEFGNEADERAADAEMRALEAEENLSKVRLELEDFKSECLMLREKEVRATEEVHMLRRHIDELDCTRLSASENDALKKEDQELQLQLLSAVSSLPQCCNCETLTQDLGTLKKDNEQLKINLHRAEEEAKLLFDDNMMMEELLKKYNKERQLHASGGENANSTANGKRKSRPRTANTNEQASDLSGPDSSRLPLSPLQPNSPESRMHKK